MISGWVALWRPAEIFLHEWWPILAEARLYDRLAVMPVTLLGITFMVREGLTLGRMRRLATRPGEAEEEAR